MNGPLKEPGYAAISVDENYISLRAILYDTDMYSESTGEDQPMWMLGDVLEFFFWLPPRNDYYETQVSINGDKLQIHLNEFYIVYDLPLESILGKCGMQAKIRRFPSKNVWYGKIQIPLKEIGVTKASGTKLHFNMMHNRLDDGKMVNSALGAKYYSGDQYAMVLE